MKRPDEREFAQFVRGASPQLLRLAWLLTGRDADAEDLVQEALVRAYVAWPRLDDAGALAYSRRIVVNLQTDRIRRRHGEVVTDNLPERSVDDRAERVANADQLARALATLPARERQCVVLRHDADLSETDVADILGVSVGTVKSSTSRGLARLREALSPEGARHV